MSAPLRTTACDDNTFTELGHDRPAGTTLASTPGDLAPEGHRVPGHPRRRGPLHGLRLMPGDRRTHPRVPGLSGRPVGIDGHGDAGRGTDIGAHEPTGEGHRAPDGPDHDNNHGGTSHGGGAGTGGNEDGASLHHARLAVGLH